MKALILSAGLGTRLKPFTHKHPKALAKVNGRTLLEIAIHNLQRFGIYDVVVNVHHFADQIIDLLHKENGFGSRFTISDEVDCVLETGGGLKKAEILLSDSKPFIVLNVDIISDIDLNRMKEYHIRQNALATLAVQKRTSSRFLLFEESSKQLYGWKNAITEELKIPGRAYEKLITTGIEYAFSGIQFLSQDIFKMINLEGKFSLIDLYLDLCSSNKIIAYDHSADIVLDVGKPESLMHAEKLLKENNFYEF